MQGPTENNNWKVSLLDNEYVTKTIVDRIIDAEHEFRNAGSFAIGRSAIKNLYQCMSVAQDQKLPYHTLYLLSTKIISNLLESIGNHQNIDPNQNDYLRKVILTAVIWHTQYQAIRQPKLHSEVFNISKCFPLDEDFNNIQKEYQYLDINFNQTVFDIINAYNEKATTSATTLIKNIIFWTWPGKTTYSLKNMWSNFDVTHKNDFGIRFSIGLVNEDRFIVHATSVEGFMEMLKEMKNSNESFINLLPQGIKTTQYTSPKLVWTGVCLKEDEIKKVPSFSQKYFDGSENRYGSVVLKFPLKKVLEERFGNDPSKYLGLILGTRKYITEFSKTILVPSASPSHHIQLGELGENFGYLFETRAVHRLDVIDLNNFGFPLDFNGSDWTHPELAFVDNLRIPFQNVTISFSPHSSCISEKRKTCKDCNATYEREEQDGKKSKVTGINNINATKNYFKYRLRVESLTPYLVEKFKPSMFKQDGIFEYLTT